MALGTEQELDRSESASPYKLTEARKRGQVARSADVVSALVITMAAVLLYAKGWDVLVELFKLDRFLLLRTNGVGQQLPSAWALWELLANALQASLLMLLPIAAALLIVAVLANIVQTGPMWSWHPIKPDWQRLNPIAGFRRVWSMRTLFDAAKALLKLLVLSIVVAGAILDLLPAFQQLAGVTPRGQAGLLVRDMATLAMNVAVALCLIALLDFVFSRREFAKNMRMSRRELRDEHKHREGDPRIRSRLRELRREMLKRARALGRTAQADVVVTNPTHYAVALCYHHGEMAAPVVLCKGAGGLAAAMRVIAARHRVPVLRSPQLARALHAKSRLDAPIPVELYPDVARLMVWVLAMKANRQASMRSVA